MRPKTRQWLKIGALSAGAVGLGSVVLLWARRHKRGGLGDAPVPPPAPADPFVLDLSAIEVATLPGEAGPQSGKIVRDMSGGNDGDWIDDRRVYLGPMLPAVPPGQLLVVDVELRTESEPPAIPGASASPCYGYAEHLEVDDELHVRRSKVTWPAGCERLQKQGGRDYDVNFPDVKVVRRPDGIYLRYTWIRFGHPQSMLIYYARDYTVTARWQLV